MPKQVTDIKEFVALSQRPDTTNVRVTKNKDNVKFKARTAKYLFTLVVKDKQKAAKLEASLAPKIKSLSKK